MYNIRSTFIPNVGWLLSLSNLNSYCCLVERAKVDLIHIRVMNFRPAHTLSLHLCFLFLLHSRRRSEWPILLPSTRLPFLPLLHSLSLSTLWKLSSISCVSCLIALTFCMCHFQFHFHSIPYHFTVALLLLAQIELRKYIHRKSAREIFMLAFAIQFVCKSWTQLKNRTRSVGRGGRWQLQNAAGMIITVSCFQ